MAVGKVVGVYFSKENHLPEQGSKPARYHALRDIDYELEKLGANLVLLAGTESFQPPDTFRRSWQFDQHYGLVENGPVTVDLLWERSHFAKPVGFPIINHPELWRACHDKLLMQKMFPAFFPKTIGVSGMQYLPAALARLQGKLKVMKSTLSAHSQAVIIGSDKEILARPMPFPAIVQEYIDTSVGLTDVTGGEHDLRVIMLNSHPALAMVRIPPFGEHRAGIKLGASTIFPDFGELPDAVKHLVEAVDFEFGQYAGRAYAIDCAMSANGPKLIELGASFALWPSKEHKNLESFNKKLAEHFLDFIG